MGEKFSLITGVAAGGAGLVAQASVPIDSTLAERLGAAGVVVVILLVVLRWASVQIQKKDDRIEAQQLAHLASQKETAQMVYTALLANTTSNERVERAITANTTSNERVERSVSANTTQLEELRKHLSRSVPS